jgi:hypothetical protein
MKNKQFYIVETGIEKLIRIKKEQEKMKDMAEEVDEYMLKKKLEENMPKLKFGRKR